MATRKRQRVVMPRPVGPYNRRLPAYGAHLPPRTGIRRIRVRHFARQEATGALLLLAVVTGVGYMMYLVAMS